jgi:hypothetical protein
MVDLVVEELDHINMNGHNNIILLNLFLKEVMRFLLVEKVVLVKDILVDMGGKDIHNLNPRWVLAAAVEALAIRVLTHQVQAMDPPMDIHIQTMVSIHFGMDKVDLVVRVELSLCLTLLI